MSPAQSNPPGPEDEPLQAELHRKDSEIQRLQQRLQCLAQDSKRVLVAGRQMMQVAHREAVAGRVLEEGLMEELRTLRAQQSRAKELKASFFASSASAVSPSRSPVNSQDLSPCTVGLGQPCGGGLLAELRDALASSNTDDAALWVLLDLQDSQQAQTALVQELLEIAGSLEGTVERLAEENRSLREGSQRPASPPHDEDTMEVLSPGLANLRHESHALSSALSQSFTSPALRRQKGHSELESSRSTSPAGLLLSPTTPHRLRTPDSSKCQDDAQSGTAASQDENILVPLNSVQPVEASTMRVSSLPPRSRSRSRSQSTGPVFAGHVNNLKNFVGNFEKLAGHRELRSTMKELNQCQTMREQLELIRGSTSS